MNFTLIAYFNSDTKFSSEISDMHLGFINKVDPHTQVLKNVLKIFNKLIQVPAFKVKLKWNVI